MRNSPRYRLTSICSNEAEVLVLATRERIRFWAPDGGGYVRDVTRQPGTLGQQVYDRRGERNATLSWSGRGTLARCIRRGLDLGAVVEQSIDDAADRRERALVDAEDAAEERAMRKAVRA